MNKPTSEDNSAPVLGAKPDTIDAAEWIRQRFNIGSGFPTPLAGMMRCRWACLTMVVIAALQSVVVALGMHGWRCPLYLATGLPCPGCGLSRACAALLQGQWEAVLRYHAFAVGVPWVLAALLAGATIPGRLHERLVDLIWRLERQTGITTIAVVGFFVYYGIRLIGFPNAFMQVID